MLGEGEGAAIGGEVFHRREKGGESGFTNYIAEEKKGKYSTSFVWGKGDQQRNPSTRKRGGKILFQPWGKKGGQDSPPSRGENAVAFQKKREKKAFGLTSLSGKKTRGRKTNNGERNGVQPGHVEKKIKGEAWFFPAFAGKKKGGANEGRSSVQLKGKKDGVAYALEKKRERAPTLPIKIKKKKGGLLKIEMSLGENVGPVEQKKGRENAPFQPRKGEGEDLSVEKRKDERRRSTERGKKKRRQRKGGSTFPGWGKGGLPLWGEKEGDVFLERPVKKRKPAALLLEGKALISERKKKRN